MPKALVCGAGGFIGHHMARRLKVEGYQVSGVDLKYPEFSPSPADTFVIGDLRDSALCNSILNGGFDEVYQFAADMGGAGYIFTGKNDANILRNSALINLNVLEACRIADVGRIFYSSSACVYPEHNQRTPDRPICAEESAYPAAPDSEYGWEKLFSERLCLAYEKAWGIEVRIARFHNIMGPEGTWRGGREKAPAAVCRKVAEAPDGSEIEIWGDGLQTRSFLYIDECIEGVRRLMRSEFTGPVNIGSEEKVSINELVSMVMQIAGKNLRVKHVPGPLGVRGRTSDNRLLLEKLAWQPTRPLRDGLRRTYGWIAGELNKSEPPALAAPYGRLTLNA